MEPEPGTLSSSTGAALHSTQSTSSSTPFVCPADSLATPAPLPGLSGPVTVSNSFISDRASQSVGRDSTNSGRRTLFSLQTLGTTQSEETSGTPFSQRRSGEATGRCGRSDSPRRNVASEENGDADRALVTALSSTVGTQTSGPASQSRRTTMAYTPCMSPPTYDDADTTTNATCSREGEADAEAGPTPSTSTAVEEDSHSPIWKAETLPFSDTVLPSCSNAAQVNPPCAPRFPRRKGFRLPAHEETETTVKNETTFGEKQPTESVVDVDEAEEADEVKLTKTDPPPAASTSSGAEVLADRWGLRREPTEEEMLASLSDEQREAYRLVVKERRSVFITGGAGTGKSHLLRTIIKQLPRSTTFVTGTTGIAALNLGGSTVHSFAGCGIVDEGQKWHPVAAQIKGSKKKKETWQRCRVLIIDEVSMLSAYMFDLLEYVARFVRGNNEPFGGIQLVLTGDFLQLPPVRKQTSYHKVKGPTFAFESVVWLNVNPRVCLLSKPFRQRDTGFFRMLNEMRFGEMSNNTLDILSAKSDMSCANMVAERHVKKEEAEDIRVASSVMPNRTATNANQFVFTDGFGNALRTEYEGYTNLRPKRDEVAQQNEYYYGLLNTRDNDEFMYHVRFRGEGHFTESTVQRVVKLRAGCRVMLIKNLDVSVGLVNGSSGTVRGFVDFTKKYEFKNSTGVTPQMAREVARGKNGNPDVAHTMLPVVEFERQRPGSTVTIVMEPLLWEEKRGDRVISTTVQMPLILAYAITIHKSQGLSLTKVDIDLRNVFEAGQAYVALSRCTDFSKVRLHGFHRSKVRPDVSALAYYKALELYRKRIRWEARHLQTNLSPHSATPRRQVEEEEDLFEVNARARRQPLGPCGYHSPEDKGLRPDTGKRRRGGHEEAYGIDELEKRNRRRERHELRRMERYLKDPNNPEATRDSPLRSTSSDHSTSADDDDVDTYGRPILRTQKTMALLPDASAANEALYLDTLRQHVSKLLDLAAEVKQQITRMALPATRVHDGTLVLDTTAIFYLITGKDSARVFRTITSTNMLRLPQVVKAHLTSFSEMVAATEREPPLLEPTEPLPHDGAIVASSDVAKAERTGHANTTPTSSEGDDEEEEEEDGPGALRALVDAAVDGLALIDEWKAALILDEQRPNEVAPLDVEGTVLPAWYKYAEMLPLVQPLIPGWTDDTPSQSTHGGSTATGGAAGEAPVTVSELDFLLNRDPRETHTHRGVLEYALDLRRRYGKRVAVCTDSPTLAAYTLALDMPVVAVGALAAGQ